MSDDNNRQDANNHQGDFRYWTQSIDGTLYGCWYRLRADGQIEVYARGHRVILPLEAISLLPESVARAVLAHLRAPAASSEHVGAVEAPISASQDMSGSANASDEASDQEP